MGKIKYRKFKFLDLKLFIQLSFKIGKNPIDYRYHLLKNIFSFIFVKSIGRHSWYFRDFFNIYVITIDGKTVAFIRLIHSHLYKCTACFKDDERLYRRFGVIVPQYRNKGLAKHIFRLDSERIFPGSKVFGLVNKENIPAIKMQKGLDRLIYSKIFIYIVEPKILNNEWDKKTINNLEIIPYSANLSKKVYELYKSNTPNRIKQMDSVKHQDFNVSKLDQILGKITFLNYCEKGFLIYFKGTLFMYLAITIFPRSKIAQIRFIGGMENTHILERLLYQIFEMRLFTNVRKYEMAICEYQKELLKLMKKKNIRKNKTFFCTVNKNASSNVA